EERLRRLFVLLALEQALAQPELRIGGPAVAWIFLQEGAEAVLGHRVVLAQHVPVGEIVGVLGLFARRRDGSDRARAAEIARRRRGQRPGLRLVALAWRAR